ncbi:MAG: class I SAM-dependent methyltransferase [Rickettsiales bacterium]|jgi:hypothetical protein|nr:class I SAM-dependent methyltransferase [Rickettsiales bacterium]
MGEQTKAYITGVKNFFGDTINSILEVQCGGGYDIENCVVLQDKNLNYIGVDVDDKIIRDNRNYFKKEKNKIFMTLDASNEPLPKSDLVVCVGVMEYLPNANIWSLIENIRESGAKYVAFDYYCSAFNDLNINEDIKILTENGPYEKEKAKLKEQPKSRAINLIESPFYFPNPDILFPTVNINKLVAFYEIKDIYLYMDWCNADVSLIRKMLIPLFESKFNEIKDLFIKNEAEYLFLDVMKTTEFSWEKYYYEEPYKAIVFDNRLYIDFFNLLKCQNDKEQMKILLEKIFVFNDLISENCLWVQCLLRDFVSYKTTGDFVYL